MKSRIGSLAFGLTALMILCFQAVVGCNTIEGESLHGVAFIADVAVTKTGMLQKLTIASIVIVVLSVVVLFTDRYLDKKTFRK